MGSYWEELKAANGHMSNGQKNLFKIIGIFLALVLIKKIIDNPGILIMIGVLIVSIMLHEVAHGYAAHLYGDDTAKNAGRLTLNPLKHIDIVGLLLPMLLILTGSSFIIGWAKPVPVNFYKIKKKEEGIFVVAIAGILTNLLLAFLGATLYKYLPKSLIDNIYISITVIYLIQLNVTLAVFNLLPIPPLDGSKVLVSFGNKTINSFIYSMDKFGVFILVMLMWLGLLPKLMQPLYNIIYGALNTFIKF